MSETYWVPGEPATFATKKERKWKEALQSKMVEVIPRECEGVSFDFVLSTLAPNRQPLDVDNLCEPVFSVLSGKLGWFGGRRPNIKYWSACKSVGEKTGVYIKVSDFEFNMDSKLTVVFDSVYSGVLPKKATDRNFIDWVEQQVASDIQRRERYSMKIELGGLAVNIGEIATGKVKPIIDCMVPVIGGKCGAPEDWRIDRLTVVKGAKNLDNGQVRIMIWGN